MSIFASFIKKTSQKIKHGMVIYYLLDRLKSLGLIVNPYFLEKEFLIPTSDLQVNITPGIAPLTINFLDTAEIESVYNHPERNANAENYKIYDRISDGCRCCVYRYRPPK